MVTATSIDLPKAYCEVCEDYIPSGTCWKHPHQNTKWVTNSVVEFVTPEVRWVVFDVETERLFSECGGRERIEKENKWHELGLTVFGVWDSKDNRPYIYDKHTLSEGISHLESADLAVSFNGNRFDLLVLKGLLGRWIELKNNYDIHKEIKSAGAPWKGSGLGATSEKTIGRGKSGNGETAPALARQGRWGQLVTYNIDDLYLTKELMEHIRKYGWVVGADGQTYKLEVPEWFRTS